MKRSGSPAKPKLMPLVIQPQPPISAKGGRLSGQAQSVRWGLILLWFMRLLGALWMLRGLLVWMGILHIDPVLPIDMARMSLADAAMLVFFAVFDLVAAVGLWLAAPWGGVLWLVAALAQVAYQTMRPENFFENLLLNGLTILLIVIYFLLSWMAARERDAELE